jgi:hypothetical protein
MRTTGKTLFFAGIIIALFIGIIISINIGDFCNLDKENLPDSIWEYPALCFILWGFGVPIGFIFSATGILMIGGANAKKALKFGLLTLGIYLFVSFANGPMPHVPFLFGIGGAVLMTIYFLILWKNAKQFKTNIYKLAGYTSLVIGFWFTCGLGSRQYQPMLGQGESPIDIMLYFVLAMIFFWLSERRQNKSEII